MWLIVSCHLRQGDATVEAGNVQWDVVQVLVSLVRQNLLDTFLHIQGFCIVLGIQSCSLLGFKALQLGFELRVCVLVLQQTGNAVSLV